MLMAGIKVLLNLCLYPTPYCKIIKKIHYQLVWCRLVLNNIEMLVMTKKIKFVRFCWFIKILDQKWISECFHTRSWSVFCHVRVCYRWMAVVVKAMHTASKHNIYRVCSVMFKCAYKFEIMTDTQVIDVVTFDFKGTCVCCFVSGCTDYQMNWSLLQNFSKWSQWVMWNFEWNAFIHLQLADIDVKRT